MRDFFKCEVLTKMFINREDEFEKIVIEESKENENNIINYLEDSINSKFSEDEANKIMNSIFKLCSMDNEIFYKMGVADGVKLDKEIKEQLQKKYM